MIDIGNAVLREEGVSYSRLGGQLRSVAAGVLFTHHSYKHLYK